MVRAVGAAEDDDGAEDDDAAEDDDFTEGLALDATADGTTESMVAWQTGPTRTRSGIDAPNVDLH